MSRLGKREDADLLAAGGYDLFWRAGLGCQIITERDEPGLHRGRRRLFRYQGCAVSGHAGWPPGSHLAGRLRVRGRCQVTGLTPWSRCRDDRGRGRSPRRCGPVVAA